MTNTTDAIQDIYKALGINTDQLGCVMLDIKKIEMPSMPEYEDELSVHFYYGESASDIYADGYVGKSSPHITLIYGLLKSAHDYKIYIDTLLKSWDMPKTVTVAGIAVFENENYDVVHAKIELTNALKEGNALLQKLPHITNYPEYIPHITLGYIKKNQDDFIKDMVSTMEEKLLNKELTITGINYGD